MNISDHNRAIVALPPCRIEMFGGLRVAVYGQDVVRFRTRKTGELLAFLACLPAKHASREQLVSQFYPDLDEKAARNNLSQLTSFLRRQLTPPGSSSTPVLSVDRYSIGLNQNSISTDVFDFGEYLRIADTGVSGMEQIQALLDAISLYRGTLLPDVDVEWANTLRSQLAEQYILALRSTVRRLLKAGESMRALQYASMAVAADPLREESHRDLIRLQLAAGRPSAARRQYRELEELLHSEFGLGPAASTRRLLAEIESAGSPEHLPQPPDSPNLTADIHTAARRVPTGSRDADQPTQATFDSARPPSSGTITLMLADGRGLEGEARSRISSEVQRYGGGEIRTSPATIAAAFSRASDALQCAFAIQMQSGGGETVAESTRLSGIRIALDTCEIRLKEGEAPAQVLLPATRLLLASHPGQIVCMSATAYLLERDSHTSIAVTDVGMYRMNPSRPAEHVFSITRPGFEPNFPRLKAPPGWSNLLPVSRTRFVGRQPELDALRRLAVDPNVRIVTLTGSGGVGKTRLALEFSHSLVDELHGAIWWASLADLTQPDTLPERIRESLSITPLSGSTPIQQAAEILGERPSMLVLDNFEQLAEHGAPYVEQLIELAPECTLIITSRQALRIQGEYLFPVSPLPVCMAADAGFDVTNGSDSDERGNLKYLRRLLDMPAIALFVERVQAVRADFQLNLRNAEDVVEICRTLEGIPLALELAAGRTQALSLKQVRVQLRERFDLLVSRKRNIDQRHRTLRDAVDWSYALLPAPLQLLFMRLSVFRGGWDVDSAIAVAADGGEHTPNSRNEMLESMEHLVECSLIIGEDSEVGMRFTMLETLREFGSIKLADYSEQTEIHLRHCAWTIKLASGLDELNDDAEMERLLIRVGKEYSNLEGALEWCAGENGLAEHGLTLAGHLWKFWRLRGRFNEGLMHLRRAIGGPGAQSKTVSRARALTAAAELANRQADYSEAKAYGEESISISREIQHRPSIAGALYVLGDTAHLLGDDTGCTACINECMTIYRELGDSRYRVKSPFHLGIHELQQGRYAEARSLFDECIEAAKEAGDRRTQSACLNNLGTIATEQGDLSNAVSLFESSLTISREMCDPGGIAFCLNKLGYAQYLDGDYERAKNNFAESLAISREMANRPGIAWSLANLGYVVMRQMQMDLACKYFEESAGIFSLMSDDDAIAYVRQGLTQANGRANDT